MPKASGRRVVVQETEGRKTRGGRGCVGAAEQLSGERTTRAGMDESKKTQTRQSPKLSFRIACRGRPDHGDRSPDPLKEDVHPIKRASDVGLSLGGLAKKSVALATRRRRCPLPIRQPVVEPTHQTHLGGDAWQCHFVFLEGDPAMLPSVVSCSAARQTIQRPG